jgi:hypothetical protein
MPVIIERRRYSIIPGRMGQMHARMRDMLLPLFRTHGVPSPIAIWEDVQGTSIMTWLIEWPSFDIRQTTWAAFYPIFYAERAKQDIEEFVTRTDLTLIAPWTDRRFLFSAGPGACESAWHPKPLIGHGAAFRAALAGEDAGIFVNAGASRINVCDLVFGPLPQAMVILSWPNADARRTGMARLAEQPAPSALARGIGLSNGSLVKHGLWENFDRVAYLETWRTA